uniref:ATP-dependent DNA helicase n=1 Tax=Octopus bimaculoides TaxID=37653 RepID=A0A0L8IB38_OCTBM
MVAGGIFFLDAPAGTGKTFVTKLILAEIRRTQGIALAVASSGIAALLPGGRTAHSTFKLPLDLAKTDTPICNISNSSDQAEVFRRCKLIVWDEYTMAHRGALEALDRSLRDIKDSTVPMGGITLLCSGDIRQTLPVIPKGNRADTVRACLKSSALWPLMKTLKLHSNMRAHMRSDVASAEFSHTLLAFGEAKTSCDEKGNIAIDSLCTIVDTPSDLTDAVFPDLQVNYHNMDWIGQRAILAPKNTTSIDTIPDPEDVINYPIEVLNSLEPPGLPPHILKLKVGAPIMLIRNLVPPKQCNGTRLIVKSLSPNLIEATIITGCGRGNVVLIPRMHLFPSAADLPFTFRRTQ